MRNLPRAVQFYISILSIAAGAILFHSLGFMHLNPDTVKAVMFFIAISVILESFTIRLPKGGNWSVAFAVDLASIVLFGPYVAIWVALGGELFKKDNINGKNPIYKIMFNMSQFVLSAWVAGTVYQLMGGKMESQPVSSMLPFIGATLTYAVVNLSAVTLVLTLSAKSSPWTIFSANFKWLAPNFLAFAPLAILMAAMYRITGLWGITLFFVPLLLARYIFKSYMETRQIYLDTLEALASTLDAKDKYTKGHSDRVAMYAVNIAREMGLPADRIETIEQMALLHDIGKLGISGKILSCPGKLTDSEFEQIKLHPVIGANILKEIHYLDHITEYVKYHHEKYDGSGYPHKIKGEEIPLEARIITLADSFDAMTSDRSYRLGMSLEQAVEEVKKSSGSHFDPKIVQAFLQTLNHEIMAGLKKEMAS